MTLVEQAELLGELETQARQAAMRRHHVLSSFQPVNGHIHRAGCIKCGMEVDVNTRPLPGEIDVGGEAVGLNCTG